MSYRNTLTAFNIWIGPDDYLGRATTFQPSEMTSILVDYRGGGMLGPVPIDMGVELGESTIEFGGFEADAIARFGPQDSDTQIIARGGLVTNGETEARSLQITQTGKVTVGGFGAWTPGETAPLTITQRPTYIKWELAGAKIIEIDLINMIQYVGSEDRLAALRTAIGV